MLDHLLWSVMSFGLTVAAARGLGPEGVGALTVGFAAALLAMGLARSFILDPFLATPPAVDQVTGARAVLTLSLGGGALASLVSLLAGALAGGDVGVGLAAFAPWVLPVVIQDALRAAAYRADRVGDATAGRAVWLATACALFSGGLRGSVGALAAAWGLGAGAAAVLMAWRLKARLVPRALAVRFWCRELRQVGGPAGAAGILDGLASQVEVYLAAGAAGLADLGGFRAAVSVFAPLTLLRPALGQVGLPRVARAMAENYRAAAGLSAAVAAVLMGACLVYAGGAAAYGRVLPLVFGETFHGYSHLLFPLTVSQLISGAGTGVHLYLLAAGQGVAVLMSTAVAVPLRLAATALLGLYFGATGLAWSLAVGAGAALVVGGAALVADVCRRGHRPVRVPAAGGLPGGR